jgi:hypothetical protein
MRGQRARRRIGRTATSLAGAFVVVFALTGCGPERLCGPDTHSPIIDFIFCRGGSDSTDSSGATGPEASRHLSSAAPARRLFSARLDARPVPGHAGVPQQRGDVQSVRGMLVTGRFKGTLVRVRPVPPAEALVGRLLRAGYRARLDASVNAKAKTSTTTMLALATMTRRSQACLRITIAERPGRPPMGSFRVLGGSGDATRLSATGTFSFRPGGDSTVTGSVKARLATARGLPRACAALK